MLCGYILTGLSPSLSAGWLYLVILNNLDVMWLYTDWAITKLIGWLVVSGDIK
jgi:hypothetical protein